jgi:hypothetical protein
MRRFFSIFVLKYYAKTDFISTRIIRKAPQNGTVYYFDAELFLCFPVPMLVPRYIDCSKRAAFAYSKAQFSLRSLKNSL